MILEKNIEIFQIKTVIIELNPTVTISPLHLNKKQNKTTKSNSHT